MKQQSQGIKKRGVSIVIGYVLLVVIAIALSAIVYNYVKLSIPKEKPTCPADISLSYFNLSCSGDQLNVGLMNNGLFKIDAVYLRLEDDQTKKVTSLESGKDNALFFLDQTGGSDEPGLFPSKSFYKAYSGKTVAGKNYSLEAQPAVFYGRKLAVCEMLIKSNVYC